MGQLISFINFIVGSNDNKNRKNAYANFIKNTCSFFYKLAVKIIIKAIA